MAADPRAVATATSALSNLLQGPVGTVFVLKDLVPEDEWLLLRKGIRISAGTVFHRLAQAEHTTIRCLGRNAENHQEYKRIA